MSAAEKANRKLGEQAAALTVPEEFVTGFRDLAAASLGQLARGESVSRQELSTRAVETVGFLERDLGSATGAVDFERSCQATTESLLEGWGDDPSATLRRVRRETDVWALAYQRYVRPELGQYHG
ncbi:hypothetical protein ACFYZE_01085 [Streptomyces sp. NPDC001796]|uniref:hypothetical protein n=1 Tax=Streptomyces sp. NPDC001796 TaxID=3364609 RepID=UPI0036C5B747